MTVKAALQKTSEGTLGTGLEQWKYQAHEPQEKKINFIRATKVTQENSKGEKWKCAIQQNNKPIINRVNCRRKEYNQEESRKYTEFPQNQL